MHGEILYSLIAKGTFVLAEYETVAHKASSVTDIKALEPVLNCDTNRHDAKDLLGLDYNNQHNNSRSDIYHGEQKATTNCSQHEDFASMARKVLGRIRRAPGSHSYLYGSYMFTYAVRNTLLVMCISPISLGHDAPCCFLNELLTRPELLRTGEAAVLTRVLRDMLECKSDGQGSGLFGTAAQLAAAEEKLNSVATVVKDNLRRVINRSENIENLLNKASDLSTEAFNFRASSRQLHRRLWCANLRSSMTILISVAAVRFVVWILSAGFK